MCMYHRIDEALVRRLLKGRLQDERKELTLEFGLLFLKTLQRNQLKQINHQLTDLSLGPP